MSHNLRLWIPSPAVAAPGPLTAPLASSPASGLAASPERCRRKNTPSGQMTWAVHVTLAPSWLDPSETLALATPYMLLCGARRPAQAHARQLHVPLSRHEVERERGRPDV